MGDMKLLLHAIAEGHSHAEELLRIDPSHLEAKDGAGETALHYLVIENRLEDARWLIERGADVNTRDDDDRGDTPLTHAASLGHLEMVELLLLNGARFDVCGLHGCALASASSPAIVERLVAAGADPNFAGEGEPALLQALLFGRRAVAEALVRAGARPEVQGAFGETVLHAAATHGDVDTVQWVLGLNIDIHAKDASGGTALHAAAAGGSIPTIEHLLAVGLDPTARTDRNETPAELAHRMGKEQAATFLRGMEKP
jgi:uncharacterized protein